MNDKILETGQVWQTIEAQNKVIILFIETILGNEIVHIGSFDKADKAGKADKADKELPMHMPFSTQAFKNSVDVLVSTEEEFIFPAYGYNYWKNEFLAKKAGVYSIDIDDVLKL